MLRRYLSPTRALLLAGLALSVVAAFDPAQRAARVVGPLLAGLALAWEGVARRPSRRRVFLAVLAACLSLGAGAEPEYRRADFRTYFQYLQSAAFDHDLDFRNEAARWGSVPLPDTPVGRRPTDATLGPALLWSPFFVLAHLYVRAGNLVGFARYAADGFSPPYFGAALLGTLVWALLGAWALGDVLARRLSAAIASVAVVVAVGASTIVFYLFVQPGMSHGLVFGLLSLLIRAADDAERDPSRGAFLRVGLVASLLVLVRPQAVLACVFLVPVAVGLKARGRLPLGWLVAAAALALVVWIPQLIAWHSIYGQWLPTGGRLETWSQRLPAGRPGFGRYSTWFDPGSPHLGLVLLSADHGLFAWSPVLLLGIAALPFAIRRFGALAVGGLLVFVLTAWFNGALSTPTAGDSFGARRFDVLVPFAALGLAVVLGACVARPLLAPSLLLGGFVVWNVGLIRLARWRLVTSAAPFEQVARLQARQARDASESALGRWFGAEGRAFAYRFFVGEYFFGDSNRHGLIPLADPDSPYLAGGWSAAENDAGPPRQRRALYPRSCVRFPLMAAAPLRVTISARAPARLERQALRVSLNGHVHDAPELAAAWSEAVVRFPEEEALPGVNLLCLEFDRQTARADGSGAAALVRRFEVRSETPVNPTPLWGRRHPTP